MLTAGPTLDIENEIRPAAMLKLLLMLVYELSSPTWLVSSSLYSMCWMPT